MKISQVSDLSEQHFLQQFDNDFFVLFNLFISIYKYMLHKIFS